METTDYGSFRSARRLLILPANTSPVVPSIETQSPSFRVTERPLTENSRFSTSTSNAITPTTAGLPNWRATSAAWLGRPPRLVGMPPAARTPGRDVEAGGDQVTARLGRFLVGNVELRMQEVIDVFGLDTFDRLGFGDQF